MNFNVNININSTANDKLSSKIKELFTLYLEETIKGNKIAVYYENANSDNVISINPDICFYAASSIKILVCLILFEQAENKTINLHDKFLISKSDIKQGTGIIKLQSKDTEYTLLDLIRLCLVESDNTAYIKLVNIVGKQSISSYGHSLGATHTMEGKDTDSFGITNCQDMIIYWKRIKEYINTNTPYSMLLKEYLSKPSTKLISQDSVNNNIFLRKYGAFDIAYHEAGYVIDENPYYLIILTQLNKLNYKERFVNDTAKLISQIHEIINERS